MSDPSPASTSMRVRFAEFELDQDNALLLRHGKAVALAPTPFNLLCALARQPGTLLMKGALLDAVWGHQFVTESVLKTAISDLRTALADNPRDPRIIETVSRRGYRFIASTAAVAAQPPAPALPELQRSPSFIGRSGAIARLQGGWEQARRGQRALIWIAGEPGIGKTTVVEHFVAGLGDVVCARGQCVDHYGAGEPYLPVLEALAELCRKDASLPALLRSVAPTWLLQLPWLSSADEREALRRELAGVGADRMLREMGELLDRYTEHRPLLLVTEDLHWSDRATLQLIDHVSRRRGRACLMWLASFRVAEVVAQEHPLNPLRRELRLHRLCEEVVLDPFSEAEVADYIARRSPSLARDEPFVRALHERTDGVPLFVSSIVTDIMEQTDEDMPVDARLAAVAVPENLAAITDHYIAKLDGPQRALLEAAAVCGLEFRSDTLAPILGGDVLSVAQACDELVRGHVWLVPVQARDSGDGPEQAYAFRHALFREVLYERMSSAMRVRLHRELGMGLERERAMGVPVPASILAMHFDRGRQPMSALRYYAEAAETALRHFSPTACMSLTERAAAMLKQAPESAERNALEISLTTLQGMSAFHLYGVGAVARRAFERAYTLLDEAPGHAIRARLLHGFGYLLNLRGEYTRALEVAQGAEKLGAVTHDPVLTLAACFLHGGVHHLKGQTRVARSWIDRGLAVAGAFDLGADEVFTADPLVSLLGMQAIELIRCGLIEQGRAQIRRANLRAHELRQPMTRLVATWQEALVEVRLNNVERLADLVDEMQALVEEFSLDQGRMACQGFRGWTQVRAGNPREGHRLIREAYEQSDRLGMRAGASEVLGYAAEALLLAGEFDAAQVQLSEALQVAGDLGERVYLPQLWLLDAAIARARDQRAASEAAVRRAVEEAIAQESPWLELLARVDLCEHHSPGAADRRALRSLVDGLTEARDAQPVRTARLLLDRHPPA